MKTQLAIAEQYLRNTPLPEQTLTYTVIPHGFIIDTIRRELLANGFNILEEKFYEGDQGDIAEGEFIIENDSDPTMGMAFHWQNSYNKKVKFGCAVIGLIYDNNTGMIGSTGAEWIRKHTGTALDEAEQTIIDLCKQTQEHFAGVLDDKESLKQIPLTDGLYGRIMGELYFEKELLNQTQASLILKERKRPMFEYQDKDTLWGLYKYIMFGIQDAYIGTWQVCQQRLHVIMMAWAHDLGSSFSPQFTQESPGSDFDIEMKAIQHPAAPEQAIAPGEITLDDIKQAAQFLHDRREVDEISEEDLEAAAEKFDSVKAETEAAEAISSLEIEAPKEMPEFDAIPEMIEIPTPVEEPAKEGPDSFEWEQPNEEEAPTQACTEEEFVEQALNESTSEVAVIYQFASEKFNPYITLDENMKIFFEFHPNKPVKKKTSKAKVEEPVMEPVTEEPTAPMSNEELLSQMGALGASVTTLSEADQELLGLVETKAASTGDMNFLDLADIHHQEPVAADEHDEKIIAFVNTFFKRVITRDDYTREQQDKIIKFQLKDSKEIGFIEA